MKPFICTLIAATFSVMLPVGLGYKKKSLISSLFARIKHEKYDIADGFFYEL
jgi:hypothetical protein